MGQAIRVVARGRALAVAGHSKLAANIVTGQPASEGKIDPSGLVLPTQPTGVIAGFGLPLPAISLGKRFGFATGWDVHLYLYLDKDAFAQQMRYFGSGGGVGFEGKRAAGIR